MDALKPIFSRPISPTTPLHHYAIEGHTQYQRDYSAPPLQPAAKPQLRLFICKFKYRITFHENILVAVNTVRRIVVLLHAHKTTYLDLKHGCGIHSCGYPAQNHASPSPKTRYPRLARSLGSRCRSAVGQRMGWSEMRPASQVLCNGGQTINSPTRQ